MLGGGAARYPSDPTRETTSDATEKHVSTIDLGAENFESTVKDNDIVFVDFWASWCGPCRQFAPVYEQASEDNPDLVFGSVNTEEERELSGAAGITSIPTLMAFKEGALVFAQPGALPPAGAHQADRRRPRARHGRRPGPGRRRGRGRHQERLTRRRVRGVSER